MVDVCMLSSLCFGSQEIESAYLGWCISERIQSLQEERSNMHAKEVGYNNELQQTQQKLVALEKVGYLHFEGCVCLSIDNHARDAVMPLVCGIAEIPRNIFICRVNGRLACLFIHRK